MSTAIEKYELSGVSGPTWGVTKQAVRHLIAVAEILSVIVHQRDEGFDQLLELARENARASWRVAAQELTVRAESSDEARRIVEDNVPRRVRDGSAPHQEVGDPRFACHCREACS